MSLERRNGKFIDSMTLPERSAMGKVADIHKEGFLKHGFMRFDPAHPSIDRLRENLLDFDRSFESYFKKEEKWLAQRSVANSFESAILRATDYQLQQKIPREGIYTILFKEDLIQEIVLVDYILGGPRPIISRIVDFNSSTMQEAVSISLQEMLLIYKDMHELCVPIYGLTGSLYWPDKMGYRDVQSFAKVRKIYGI